MKTSYLLSLFELLFLLFFSIVIVDVVVVVTAEQDDTTAPDASAPAPDVDAPYIPIQKDKWAMDFSQERMTYEDLNFMFDFDVSSWIQPGQVHLELYKSPECKDGGPSGLPGSGTLQVLGFENQPFIIDVVDPVSIPWTDTANFKKDGKTVTVPIRLNSEIANNADVYTVYVDEDGKTQARAEFCARISLRTLDPLYPTEANFMEHIITLDFKFSPLGFQLIQGASIAAADLTKAAGRNDENPYAALGGGMEGYLCNPVDGSLVDATTTIFRQGELIHACVKPIQQAIDDGVVMSSIKEFTWTRESTDQNGNNASPMSQNAISNREEAANALSFYSATDCWRQPYCTFNTFFASPFFFDGNVVISGTGSANMIYLGGTVEGAYNGRNRELNEHEREREREVTVQVSFGMKNKNGVSNKEEQQDQEQQQRRTQDDASNEGPFNLQVKLEGTEELSSFGNSSGAGTSSYTSSMKMSMLMVLSLLILFR